ncbi:MAG TPA: hypothetical protein QGF58_07130 [Myxococcota bacterium]|nr:hypothetical protein [Myxococcota bacterium]
MFLSLISLSLAQDPPVVDPGDVRYAPVTNIEFGYTRVDGKLVGPDGVLVSERPKPEITPMITLRLNFDEEMAQSVSVVK